MDSRNLCFGPSVWTQLILGINGLLGFWRLVFLAGRSLIPSKYLMVLLQSTALQLLNAEICEPRWVYLVLWAFILAISLLISYCQLTGFKFFTVVFGPSCLRNASTTHSTRLHFFFVTHCTHWSLLDIDVQKNELVQNKKTPSRRSLLRCYQDERMWDSLNKLFLHALAYDLINRGRVVSSVERESRGKVADLLGSLIGSRKYHCGWSSIAEFVCSLLSVHGGSRRF